MSAAPSPLPFASFALRRQLAEPRLRIGLAAMVRRRVPAGDAEDVVQSILCDALASTTTPVEPTEISRWLYGIARHKVADFHRRARRDEATAPGEEGVTRCDPIEARAVLVRVVAEAYEEARSRETLGWIVREHAGELLADIANDVSLPSPVVRQRVSRLRRALAARWLAPLTILAALGGSAALARFLEGAPAEIVAEPAPGPAASTLARVQGRWRVASSTSAAEVTVSVTGSRVIVDVPGLRAERAITIDEAGATGFAASLRSDRGVDRVTVRFDGEALVVTGAKGTVALTR